MLIKKYKQISFANRVLIWMFIGSVLGLVIGEKAKIVAPVGDIFLKLLIMAAIPLVFFNLLAGLGSLGSTKNFGKIGLKIIIYYLCSTAFAIALGLLVIGLLNAGEGMELTDSVPEDLGEMPNLSNVIINMVPTNIFKSFAEGELIQIVVFAILLGIVTLKLPTEQKDKFQIAYDRLADLMRKLVEFILIASPVGLGALMMATFAEFGSRIIGPLTLFIVGIYLAQLLMVVLYMLVLRLIAKIPPFWFLRKTADLYATTVATCSSLASLSVSMDIAEEKLKLPKSIFSFTLPIGAQFNKDGTAIMLSGILMFTAQAAGLELSIPQLIQIIVVGLILSEGSTGIPGGGLVVAMLFAKAFNLPLEIVAIVGGIYRLIDMGNTTVNCMGDLVATSVIAKLEKQWNPEI